MQSIINENKIKRSQRSEFWLIFSCLRNLRSPAYSMVESSISPKLVSLPACKIGAMLFTVPIILHYVFELLISQQLAVIDATSCARPGAPRMFTNTSRDEQWSDETWFHWKAWREEIDKEQTLPVIYEARRMVTSHRECHYREWIWIVRLADKTLSRFRYLRSHRRRRGEKKGIAWWFATFLRSHSDRFFLSARQPNDRSKEGEKN